MKLMRYNLVGERTERPRLGVLLNGDIVGDLCAGYARNLTNLDDAQALEAAARRMPSNLADFLAGGEQAWTTARETAEFLQVLSNATAEVSGVEHGRLFAHLHECRLHAPIRPSKVIAVGRNYAKHLQAAGLSQTRPPVPSAWIKANSAITGPNSDIVKPACTQELDYETELAVVIAHRCKNVKAERAYDVVAGYTIVNDVSARDVGRLERKGGSKLLEKMFDGFAPMGPWLVTRDEVRNPMDLRIVTRVNGEVRQSASTKEMIWSIPELIAYLSQMTLEPGDLILTGTPEGTAVEHGSQPSPGYLHANDILESEIESIGLLRNRIIDETGTGGSWAW